MSEKVSAMLDGVFPAGAGVILVDQIALDASIGVPRRCGGDPRLSNYKEDSIMCSPQVRG